MSEALHPNSNQMNATFSAIDQVEYRNGARHLYGVDSEGKKHHISFDAVADSYSAGDIEKGADGRYEPVTSGDQLDQKLDELTATAHKNLDEFVSSLPDFEPITDQERAFARKQLELDAQGSGDKDTPTITTDNSNVEQSRMMRMYESVDHQLGKTLAKGSGWIREKYSNTVEKLGPRNTKIAIGLGFIATTAVYGYIAHQTGEMVDDGQMLAAGSPDDIEKTDSIGGAIFETQPSSPEIEKTESIGGTNLPNHLDVEDSAVESTAPLDHGSATSSSFFSDLFEKINEKINDKSNEGSHQVEKVTPGDIHDLNRPETLEGKLAEAEGKLGELNIPDAESYTSAESSPSEGTETSVSPAPNILNEPFSVEKGNGYTHEIVDMAKAHGIELTPEEAFHLHQEIVDVEGADYLDMLDTDINDVYSMGDSEYEVGISSPSDEAVWTDGAQDIFADQLDLATKTETIEVDPTDKSTPIETQSNGEVTNAEEKLLEANPEEASFETVIDGETLPNTNVELIVSELESAKKSGDLGILNKFIYLGFMKDLARTIMENTPNNYVDASGEAQSGSQIVEIIDGTSDVMFKNAMGSNEVPEYVIDLFDSSIKKWHVKK